MSSIAVGDLNGDSRPDVAATLEFEDQVSILLNQGDGRFRDGGTYSLGTDAEAHPGSISIGDLNDDGKQDLALSPCESTDAVVLLNRGNGRFNGPHRYQAGVSACSMAIADVTGDGRPDLVLGGGGPDTSAVSVLANDRNHTFAQRRLYRTRYGSEDLGIEDVAVADMNGDGNPEIVGLAGIDPQRVVLFSNLSGRLTSTSAFRAPDVDTMAVGDVNGDGRPEVVTATSNTNTVHVFTNRGDGTFLRARSFASGELAEVKPTVAIGDVTGDGKPDLLTAGGAVTRVFVLANSTGGRKH